MDVPSWHPANQNSDALRRLAAGGGASVPKRTEFKVVDTSTEEERQQVAKEDDLWQNTGRAVLQDPSDRLYLMEQTRLEQQMHSREQHERDIALQTFRSKALKVHKHKTSEIALAVGSGKVVQRPPEKKPAVVIKAKRRRATEKEPKAKQAKTINKKADNFAQDDTKTREQDDKKEEAAAKTVPLKSPALALLLQDYSSSSDEE